ncbi:hypothetical protein ACGF5O_14015 [Streptomyces sp. NPDC048291]|uniref:hypothetical protein n=1 Tax=Streptomyces sp. NPDC048291 TaxID=3365530 RepID=UPI00371E4D3D
MDQGIAALIAAGFGLVGAAVGGAAAVWGARIGAERSAQAVKQQVQDQAAVEHAHWIRQQRLEAYEGFEDTYAQLARLVGRVGRDIPEAPDLLRILARCCARIEILGPLEVSFRALQVTTGLGIRVADLEVLRRLDTGDGGEPSEEYSQMAARLQADNSRNEDHQSFIRAAQKAMGTYLQ